MKKTWLAAPPFGIEARDDFARDISGRTVLHSASQPWGADFYRNCQGFVTPGMTFNNPGDCQIS